MSELDTFPWPTVPSGGGPRSGGEGFRQLEKEGREATNRVAQLGEVGPAPVKSAQRMGMGIDGANIHIRQEGWKELKVGCLFDIDIRLIFDPDTKERLGPY